MVGGVNFSLKTLHFKFEKMNPIKGLGKIFSVKGLVKLTKSLLKVFFRNYFISSFNFLSPRCNQHK